MYFGIVPAPALVVKIFQEAGNTGYTVEPQLQNKASGKFFQKNSNNRFNQRKSRDRNTLTFAEVSTGISK